MHLCLLVVQNFLLDSGFKQLQRAMLARSSRRIALLDHFASARMLMAIVEVEALSIFRLTIVLLCPDSSTDIRESSVNNEAAQAWKGKGPSEFPLQCQ
jgi:hypothetical protein